MRRGAGVFALLLGVLALAGGGSAVRGLLTRAMLYPVPPVPVPSPPPPPLEEVVLDSSEGKVVAWHRPPSEAGPLVLVLHGNGENLETMRRAGLFESWEAVGAGVLAVDYPGYGRSAGRPSEGALVAAATAALGWLAERAEDRTVVVAGWSLGAAVGIEAVRAHLDAVDGVVLMSPWSTLPEVAAAHFPRFLVRLILDESYDSLAAASGLTMPKLVVHGAADRIIPTRLGRRLFERLPEPKRWVEVEGAGHNDLLARREPWQEVERFLSGLEGGGAAD